MNKFKLILAGTVGTTLLILGLFFAFIFTAISINERQVASIPLAGSMAAIVLGIYLIKYVAKTKNETVIEVVLDYLSFHWN